MNRSIIITEHADGSSTVELRFRDRSKEPTVEQKVDFLVEAAGNLLDIADRLSEDTTTKQPLSNQ